MEASKPDFFKIMIGEDSSIGSGQSIKADREAQKSVAGLKNTLFEVFKTNMDEYKISYLDNDGERIRIEDDQDWATCVEELYSLPLSAFAKGLTLFIEKQVTQSKPVVQTNTPASSPAEDDSSKKSDAPQPVLETAKPPPEEPQAPAIGKVEAIEDKKPSSAHTSCFSNIPKPIEPPAPSYKFGYSSEELEWIKKVTPSVYAKIEGIFEEKIDSKLIESERAFKHYHQQQLKLRTGQLEKQIEELKQRVNAQEQEMKIQRQVPFSNALVTNTFVTHPTMINTFTPGSLNQAVQQTYCTPQPVQKTDQGQRNKYCHLEICCNECQQFPIKGIRYKALMKRDFDLCEECFLANKDTKEAYLALRETEPQDNNHLVQLARASQLNSYEQKNKTMKRYHKWETEEDAEQRKIEQEADKFTDLHYH
jgi:hypothetical protein